MSTIRSENDSFPRIFKGRPLRTGRLERRGALPAVRPYLRTTRFQGRPDRQKEKRTLPRATAAVSGFAYVAVKVSEVGFRNINPDSLSASGRPEVDPEGPDRLRSRG